MFLAGIASATTTTASSDVALLSNMSSVEPFVDPRDGRLKLLMELDFGRRLMIKAITTETELEVSQEGHIQKDAIIANVQTQVMELREEVAHQKELTASTMAAMQASFNKQIQAERGRSVKLLITGVISGVIAGMLVSK